MVSRPDFWVARGLLVRPTRVERASFEAVHEDEHGRPDGYVSYEIKGQWHGGVANRQPRRVGFSKRPTPQARAALWEYVFGVDPRRARSASTNLPVDEPLRFLLADSRKLRTDFLIDSVWVLPLDAAALLGARKYSTTGKLAIEIVDSDGSRELVALEGGPDGASCTSRTRSLPDLSCSRATLGSVSLGGTSWTTLAAGGSRRRSIRPARSPTRRRTDVRHTRLYSPATISWF